LGFVAALASAGVAGFVVLEHETFLDAILTTISAISTVGYSPPHPLSTAGKVLAIVLILGGLFGIALVISLLTEYFIEGDVLGAWERRRMDRAIDQLHDHFIISGFGRVGREVAETLTQAGMRFVVLDHNPEPVAAAAAAGYVYIPENAAHDEVLERAGIHRARGLIACGDSDSNNVYVTLTARSLNPNIFIVARAAYADAEPKLYKAGANRVVSPYVMAGRHMAALASRPLVADYLNLLFDGQPIDLQIRELYVEPSSALAGRSVRELQATTLAGAFILALDRDGQRMREVQPDVVLEPGDHVLLVGTGGQLERAAGTSQASAG
jgi:voltage-gated potassium channel